MECLYFQSRQVTENGMFHGTLLRVGVVQATEDANCILMEQENYGGKTG